MNPGVTFLMFLRRQISAVKMASYIVCQLVGALLASALVFGSSSGLNDLAGKVSQSWQRLKSACALSNTVRISQLCF